MSRDWIITPIAQLYSRIDRRPRLAVMTLHRTSGVNGIPARQIERECELLASRNTVLSPAELGRLRKHSAAGWITIDDGHSDTYEVIFPIAKKLGLPITICVSTDFLLRKAWLWFDQVNYAVVNAAPGSAWEHRGRRYQLNMQNRRDILGIIKRLSPAEREPLIAQVVQAAGCCLPNHPPQDFAAVTLTQMQEMLASGLVTLAAHTVTHTIATILSPEEFAAELRQCKRELEEIAGCRVDTFCYPNGLPEDFDYQTTQAVREAGFTWALTSVSGVNRWASLDPLQVKRVHAHKRLAVFAKGISGLADIHTGRAPLLQQASVL